MAIRREFFEPPDLAEVDAEVAKQEWQLEAPPGVEVESPALRIPSLGEVNWRLRACEPGSHTVTVRSRDATFTKTVNTHPSPGRLSPRRVSGLSAILAPAEPPLPPGAEVAAIQVAYPTGSIPVGPWRAHWVLAFLVGTFLFAMLLRGPLRAQF